MRNSWHDRLAPASAGLLLVVTSFLVLAQGARAQRLVFVNAFQGRLVVRDRDMIERAASPPFGLPRMVASDGCREAWATALLIPALYRLRLQDGFLEAIPLPAPGAAVALSPQGGAVVTAAAAPGGGLIIGVSPTGALLWQMPCQDGAERMLIAESGIIWVQHRTPSGLGMVARHGADGSLLSLHPLGQDPIAMVPAAAGRVWVLCRASRELWHLDADGSVIATLPIAAGGRVLLPRPSGDFYVLYQGGAVDLRSAEGDLLIETSLGSDCLGAGLDGRDELFRLSSGGLLARTGPWFEDPLTFGLPAGEFVTGDWTGIGHALSAGLDADPDGDGLTSRIEWQYGCDPLDGGSTPFHLSVGPGLAVGATVTLDLEVRGLSYGVYLLGASHAAAAPGQGALGFSLAPGAVFDWVAAHRSTVFGVPAGILDAYGRASTTLSIPAWPTLSGTTFQLALLASPGLGALGTVLPSPACPVTVP